jgi:hypothetical protein
MIAIFIHALKGMAIENTGRIEKNQHLFFLT